MRGVPTSMYQEALSRQLALDYCCSPADVADSKNHFTIYVPQEGRRRFQEQTVCRLKIAVVNGKLLVTGSEEIVAECRKRYADVTGEWFFEAASGIGGIAGFLRCPYCTGTSFFSAGVWWHSFF